jgi:carbon monoxide dehydrogenase subunit G
MRAGFALEAAPGGQTKVIWTGQSSVLGRIASLAGGLLEPLAKKNVQKLIDGLQKALT